MNQRTQVELVRRVLAHVEARTTDHDDGPARCPVWTYADPARLEREMQALFRGLPVAIGHASSLASPGAFVTHDASGLPLLVVRGDDGALRALFNVCRHRGTRVEAAPCGKKKAFTCPYHAWSYARDGALIGVPHEHGFAGVDRRERALAPAPASVTEALGLVWLTPPGVDVATYLGETIARDLDGFGIPSSHVYAPRTLTKELNWKLAIDVFLEAYHLRPTHRDSIYGLFFDNLGLVDRLGPHLRNVFPKRTIRELASQPEASWVLRRHANVLFFLFPNTFVLVEPDHSAVVHVWPAGPTRTVMTTYTLVPELPTTDKARAYWDANDRILHGAIEEDFAMGESIQRGLASGANEDVVFGAFEHALTHFHREIGRLVDAPTGHARDHGGTIT